MEENSRLPKTHEEFVARYKANEIVDRPGTPKAVVHMPCMFCGAPDLMVLRTFYVQEDLQRGGVCQECGRGVVVVFGKQVEVDGAVPYEVFQTQGDDPPEYLESWPRRVT